MIFLEDIILIKKISLSFFLFLVLFSPLVKTTQVFASCYPFGVQIETGQTYPYYYFSNGNNTIHYPDSCAAHAGNFTCQADGSIPPFDGNGSNWWQSCNMAAPTITSIYFSPSTILTGDSSTGYFTSNEAESCTASGSFWNGGVGASNSGGTGAMSSVGSYGQSVSCSNPGGSSGWSTAYLTVDGHSCSSPWGSVGHGYSNTAYLNSTADTCSSQVRTCNDGSMSGSYTYTSCTVNSYSITFNSAGGSAVTTITQAYGTAVTPPSAPTRTGYTFTGWTPTIASTMPSGGQSLTATWSLNLPTVTSPTITSVTNATATMGANLTSGVNITARGTCWATTPSPTTNCLADSATSTGVFTQARTGLPAGTLIYFRGYATNATGTAYSVDGSTTTLNIPTVTSPTITSLTNATATMGATVASNGGSVLTARGTCWGTTASPTSNCIAEGSTATGTFTYARTGLPAGTLIYYRGYATNAYGTGYSSDSSTTTLNSPTVTTPVSSAIGMGTTTLGATVTSNGGSVLTSRGTCYSAVSGNTTIGTGVCASDGGISVSSFSHTRIGMSPGLTYYFKGYAINAYGTSYSSEGSFNSQTLPVISTATSSSVINTSAILGATIVSTGGQTITARGTCYGTSASPLTNCAAEGGTGAGAYTHSRTGLVASTLYYFRGYITYTDGSGYSTTTYSSDSTFTTLTVPSITTATSSSVSYSSVTLGATVASDGGSPITARGTCYGTSTAPITNCSAEGGTSLSAFTHSRSGLTASTTYYFRGYASNSYSTSYSSDGTFNTLAPTTPVFDISLPATAIGTSTATLGATLLSSGGVSITARGTCWGTSPSPVTNCLVEGGVSVVPYTHIRSGLTASTTYYYRGYATNSVGTSYSADGTFTTVNIPDPSLVSVTPGNGQVTASYTNPLDGALQSIVVLRDTSPITLTPVNGVTYTAGDLVLNQGQVAYTIPGTYSWTAPAGVTSVSVVAVGSGGEGGYAHIDYGILSSGGGGGGGLGWKNNISVTPGQSYTVVVGATSTSSGGNGNDSYFINTSTVKGGKGMAGLYGDGGLGGSYTGDGGGNGGVGGSTYSYGYGSSHASGGGAGGYAGAGGIGRSYSAQIFSYFEGSSGTGGAGAGGYNSIPGGGVGITGQGTSGDYSSYSTTGMPGSNGSGVMFGGGADGKRNWESQNDSYAGTGAVRIIWGTGRSFPSTNTTDQSSSTVTVACVDTSVTPGVVDSCVTTGLTNGTPYYFKVFARNNSGNYSPGVVPFGSPATPNMTTVLGNGTNPSNSTVGPGGLSAFVNSFTFQTATSSEVISALVLNLTDASSTSLVEITNDAGTVVYGSVANPTGTSIPITLSNATLTANTSLTQYKVRVTPKTQINLPSGALGILYSVAATVTSWTGTNIKSGTDTTSATLVIDNAPPAIVTADTLTQGSTKITTNFTVPDDTDLTGTMVLFSTSAINDIPVDGTTYTQGNTIGGSTIGCVDNQVLPSMMGSCVITGLTNGTLYYFKVFTKDSYGNYSAGDIPTGSPMTPNILITSVKLASFRLRTDNGTESSATFTAAENVGNLNTFILGDKARVRFVVSNENANTSTKSYQLEYSSNTCTNWITVQRRLDTTSQHWKIEPSSYVADNTVTTHSSSMTVPGGKTFTPGRIVTFNKMTQPITLLSGQYTEVEFSLRSTANLQIDTLYCFRLTNAGEESDFVYTQIPQINPMSRVFRYNAGGGGGGYRVVDIETPSTATTTVTGGSATGTQATTTPGELPSTATTTTSTTTPSHGGGSGDVGFLGDLSKLFAYIKYNNQSAVLGDTATPICTNMKHRMTIGSTDTETEGEVSQLQFYLQQQGYLSSKITGKYLEKTKKAVEEFQRDNKIIVTGIAGNVTRSTIKHKGCKE